MKRNQFRAKRSPLANLVAAYHGNNNRNNDDDSSDSLSRQQIKHCRQKCCVRIGDESLLSNDNFTLKPTSDRLTATASYNNDTINCKPKQLLRFSDEQEHFIDKVPIIICNHNYHQHQRKHQHHNDNKSQISSSELELIVEGNEIATCCKKHQLNCLNVKNYKPKLHNCLIEQKHQLEKQQQVKQRLYNRQLQQNCCCSNSQNRIMDEDPVNDAIYGSEEPSSHVIETLRLHEQEHRELFLNHDQSLFAEPNNFFDLDSENSLTKHNVSIKKSKRAKQNDRKSKLQQQQQQQQQPHLNRIDLTSKLIDLNRQELCQLAAKIHTQKSGSSIENPSLIGAETYRQVAAEKNDQDSLFNLINQENLKKPGQCYHENIVNNFETLKSIDERQQQLQTRIKSIDSEESGTFDGYSNNNIDQLSKEKPKTTTTTTAISNHLSLLNRHSLSRVKRKTTKTSIEIDGNVLKSTSTNVQQITSNDNSSGLNEIKFANNNNCNDNSGLNEKSNTSYGAGINYEINNKTNPSRLSNCDFLSNNNNDNDNHVGIGLTPVKTSREALQKVARKTAAKTLPASLKQIGNIFSSQTNSDELINELRHLNDLEKARLDEKRKSYKSMNWRHIANIYKHHQQKPTSKKQLKQKSSDNKKKKTTKKDNSNNNINKNNLLIDNSMYLNGKLTANLNNDNSSFRQTFNGNGIGNGSNNGSGNTNNTGNTMQLDYIGQTVCSRLKRSCLCQLMVNSIHTLFPIFHAFDNYSMPSDLLADLFTGLTIAILQVPQGMAYGMLAGVDPIYGLYVSLIPVLVMAFLSKSRHVSYGTFAIISILLASSTESIRSKINLSQRSLLVTTQTTTTTMDQDNANSQQQTLSQASRIGSASQQTILKSPTIILALSPPNYDADNLQQDPNLASILQQQQPQQLLNAISAPFAPTNIEILTTICITVALLQLLMALLRLGHLAVIFSDQLVSSFTCASAFHVLTSQLAGLFDLDTPIVSEGLFKVCRTWWHVLQALLHNNNTDDYINMNNSNNFNIYTAILSLVSIAFLLSVKEILEPCLRARYTSGVVKCLPSELILMSCIVFSSWYWQFNDTYNIRIVGHIPTGLPAPKLPPVELIPYALQDAVTIALISFAMNLSLAQVYAKRFRYKMDSNQELFALGSSNLIGSFFSCFPCASSLSRSALQSNLNVRSPLAPIFSCAIVFSMIAYFAPILHDLPKSTLSCIIIIALKGVLMQCRDLSETWRLSKLDASTWLITFWAVIAFGVTYGLVIGIISSLLTIFVRILTPNYTILGQLPGTDIYVDKSAFEDCEEIEQVRIFRFNSPLCYMNRTMFRARVESALPNVYKKFNYMKLFCPNRHKVDSERDQILAHCTHIATTTTNIHAINGNNNYGGLCNSRLNNNLKVRYFIIDCSALAYCDHAGANLLLELIQELEEHKVTVYLAACPIKLVFMFERMGFGNILESHVYPTITAAVNQAKFLRDSKSNNNNTDANMNSLSIYCHH